MFYFYYWFAFVRSISVSCYFHFSFEQNSRTAATAATTTHVALHAAHTEDTDKKTGTKTVLCQSLNTRTTSEFKTNTLTSAHCSVHKHEHSASTHTLRQPYINSHLPATQHTERRVETFAEADRFNLFFFLLRLWRCCRRRRCWRCCSLCADGELNELLAQIQFIFHVIRIFLAHAIALRRFFIYFFFRDERKKKKKMIGTAATSTTKLSVSVCNLCGRGCRLTTYRRRVLRHFNFLCAMNDNDK